MGTREDERLGVERGGMEISWAGEEMRGNERRCLVCATPLGAGFVGIFIGQIHSESDVQIQ